MVYVPRLSNIHIYLFLHRPSLALFIRRAFLISDHFAVNSLSVWHSICRMHNSNWSSTCHSHVPAGQIVSSARRLVRRQRESAEVQASLGAQL